MRFSLSVLAVVIGLAGCQSTPKEEPAEMDAAPTQAQDVRGTYDHMADAAALADMTISDYHFIPHRAFLTPLGEQRLTQLAALMHEYGGQVRFNTDSKDGQLIEDRFNAVIAYLDEQGVDVTQDVLTLDMPGSIGMPASETMLIKQHEGTYKPPKSGSGGQDGVLQIMMGGGSGQ